MVCLNDKRGLAPFGWIIASHNDYKNLQSNCKNYFFYDSYKYKANELMSKNGWKNNIGTDAFGFSALAFL